MNAIKDQLAEAYRDRAVLVTGHTGFKGAWLCTWLREMGAEVFGYALDPPTTPSLFESAGIADRMDDRRGDVRDTSKVATVVAETAPDVIFHLAAEAVVRGGYEHPVETFDTNVMGVVHVLDAVRRHRRHCVVIVVTSDKCYAEGELARAHQEGDPLGGTDPYSASKGCAEIVTDAYRRSFFPPQRFKEHRVAIASVRAGNVIGGGDWGRDRIVPDIARAVLAGRPVGLRNSKAVRPWQHVLDALSGYLWLGARLLREGPAELSGPWNFGPRPESAVSVRELTERVISVWGRGEWTDAATPDAPRESAHLRLDIKKATRLLRWRPVYGIDQAIDATVQWYRSAEPGVDQYELTARQIHGYVEQARAADAVWAAQAQGVAG